VAAWHLRPGQVSLALADEREMSTSAFSSAHKLYVKSLYRRYLKNALDWTVRRDLWRKEVAQIRAEFERNRYALGPRGGALYG
jgi:NADH dehydrogenase (ubiquinone) 1 beta subcomplex subunit 9